MYKLAFIPSGVFVASLSTENTPVRTIFPEKRSDVRVLFSSSLEESEEMVFRSFRQAQMGLMVSLDENNTFCNECSQTLRIECFGR